MSYLNSFKNIEIYFRLKSRFTWNKCKLIYIVTGTIFRDEDIGEAGVDKTRIQDTVAIYRWYIRQSDEQWLKAEEHSQISRDDKFLIPSLAEMWSNLKNVKKML